MESMTQQAQKLYLDGVPTAIDPVRTTMIDTLSTAARDFPDRVAVDFLGKESTYAQIMHDVQRAVTVLTMCGVRRGDVVSLILPNCPQHYVCFYAIQALGAIASEHNPLAPSEQLLSQLTSVGARVVIAWEKTIETIARDSLHGFTFLAVDLTRALPKRSQFLLKLPVKAAKAQRAKLRGQVPPGVHSWDNQVAHAKPMNIASVPAPSTSDVAVLIQTGGTTGTPKAVALTHESILANTAQVMAWVSVLKTGAETVGAVLPFFHAFGLQLSLSVCVNLAATQVMLPSFDVDMLLAAHQRHPITMFGGVPPMFERILTAVEAKGGTEHVDLSTIRYGISGAMALSPELAARWEAATGGFLIEGYGMTEASPVIAGSPLSANRRPSTLGLPLPSTEIKVVNPDDISEEYAEGIVGEILVRGPQVFQGYFHNEEETALTLTPDGFLRTGDLGKWDHGFLVMADRRKELIINGGFNIYPSQVEAALRDMPGVRDVAVVGMPTDSLGEAVVAALVLEPGATVDLASVRAWAENRIQHYALPKSIAIFDDLPRSQLGKTLRKNVSDTLRTWELKSGEWREKISAVTAAAAERADSLGETLKDRADAFNEQLKERRETLLDRADSLNETLKERAENLRDIADGAKEKITQQSQGLQEKFLNRGEDSDPDQPSADK
ncbi:MAG: AMP-binding protein [Arcanobacterium sp.]|nr:AMP-binding protein [Arcanobacterium sp.]